MKCFNLPDLGEGLLEAEILNWHVEVSQPVEVDQPLLSVETAKAVVEIPSPVNAVIQRLCHEVGATVRVGEPLVEFQDTTTDSVSVVGTLPANSTLHSEDHFIIGAATQSGHRIASISVAGATKSPAQRSHQSKSPGP